LRACAFEPHRHDTYTIGLTTSGVQTFRYRGRPVVSLPGQLVILHPDETHDGAAGTEEGFGYRALYLAPELLREALGGGPLPFVRDPVQRPPRVVASLVADVDGTVGELARAEIAAVVADLLRSLSGRRSERRGGVDVRAVELARDYLDAHAIEQTPAAMLERVTGTDRFTLARHFRRALGTSPDRYRTLRRLERARAAIERGEPLAQVAARSGFADQSHLTRQFKRAYGLTPARWAAVRGAASSAGDSRRG